MALKLHKNFVKQYFLIIIVHLQLFACHSRSLKQGTNTVDRTLNVSRPVRVMVVDFSETFYIINKQSLDLKKIDKYFTIPIH